MSKDQLPTQKGTEVFPQTTKVPTKVRFQGVPPGSPEAQQLVQRYAAQINHFHRSQAQKYSLSTVENYRAHGRYPGLKMTYTNLQGQEIIDIRVEAGLPQPQGKVVDEIPPDFCVVDIILPGSSEVYSEIYAKLVTPAPDVYPYEYSDGATDATWDYSGLTEHPIVEASADDFATSTVTFTDRIHSLKVDFRRLPKRARVVLDLYGRADPDEYPIIGQEFAGWDHQFQGYTDTYPEQLTYTLYSHPVVSPYGVHEIPENVNYTTNHAGVFGTYPDIWADAMVATYAAPEQYHGPSELIIFSRSVTVDVVQTAGWFGAAACPSHGTGQSRGEFLATLRVQDAEWTVEPEYSPIYADSFATPAIATHAFYWPGTRLEAALTQHEYEGSMWVAAPNTLPTRATFGEMTITDGDPVGDDPEPYLGRVTIDRFPPSIRFDPT